MFSYRHAFHAGNHADVLKHLVSMHILNYLNQKPGPYQYVDTHAGAGAYELDGRFATKSGEAETGINRLWTRTDLPPAVAEYVALVRQLNPNGKLRFYPGSPYIADYLAREEDKLRLFEMHPSDSRLLIENFAKDNGSGRGRGRRVMVQVSDGFAGLKALLPPVSRRGYVLIDPPYEDKNDYRYVKDAVSDALKRFSTGTYAVWYPILNRNESRQLAERLKKLPCQSWLNVTLTIGAPNPDGFGLHSSGMFVINPPWTLEALLKGSMPYLVAVLGRDAAAGYTLESEEALPSKLRAGS